MKRILHMTPPNIRNGIYKYIFAHMKYIDQSKYQFDFLTQNRDDLMQTEEYKKYGFGIKSFTTTQREDAQKFRQEIYDILTEGYDAIHLHTSYWRGFLIEEIAMEIGMPKVIVHAHSAGVDEENPVERERLFAIHEGFKKQFNMSLATDFCACSKEAAEWLFNEQIPKEQINFFHNAIEVERFTFHKEKREQLRQRLGIESKIVMGNIGRFCYQKNQKFLIEAFAEAIKKNDELFLLLIGEGEMKEEFLSMAEVLGIQSSVLCLDWQENIEDYLQVMDVFCLPSKFEGLPISILEAQAAGLKSYVADTVSKQCKITDLVTFLPLDMETWVDAIRNCDKEYARKNMHDVITEQGYNIKVEANKLVQLYE